MSLSASMWTGVSGLLGHGEKMNVVGNNIANVSTLGFKSQRMDFEDFMYANAYSASGPVQIGRGVAIGTVMGDFSQGSFETTTSAVDLAIGGAGFFRVQPVGSETAYYTRAGNFSFDTEGYLTDPHGYALQGWKIDNTVGPTRASGGAASLSEDLKSPVKGSGVPTNVRLDTWTVPPKQTTKTSVITNLSANGKDKSQNMTNPFASLVQAWDGTQPPANNKPAIAESSYAYTTSIKVYDESGLQHTMTVYYDKVDPGTYEGKSGETMWEYMVTMNPAEDKRQVWDGSLNGGTGGLVNLSSTKMAGVVMSGTMTFNASGQATNQSAYTLMGDLPYSKDAAGNPIPDANYHWDSNDPTKRALVPVVSNTNTMDGILQSFYPASVSQSGYPMLCANFGGVPGAQTTSSPKGDDYLMEFNMGLKISQFENPWNMAANSSLYAATSIPDAGGGVLQVNPDHSDDGLHGPKVVQTSTAYNATLAASFKAAYDLDMAALPPVTTNRDAWLAATLVANPGWAAADAYKSTWPYLTTGAQNTTAGYAATTTDMQSFKSFTPNSNNVAYITPPVVRESNATTMLGTDYSTGNGTGQNGYTFGSLTGYDVNAEGILTGIYSNGVNLGLYQIALYDFTCHQGLRREGGNLYSQTMESGEARFGPAQVAGMGKINSYSLEQSNVDLSREFVQMITTQRGFQSNSKVITTTDTMLDTVINMKR